MVRTGLKFRSNYELRNLRINKDQYFISLSTKVKDIFNYKNIEKLYDNVVSKLLNQPSIEIS